MSLNFIFTVGGVGISSPKKRGEDFRDGQINHTNPEAEHMNKSNPSRRAKECSMLSRLAAVG
jgi:hypothetical protein